MRDMQEGLNQLHVMLSLSALFAMETFDQDALSEMLVANQLFVTADSENRPEARIYSSKVWWPNFGPEHLWLAIKKEGESNSWDRWEVSRRTSVPGSERQKSFERYNDEYNALLR